MIPTLLREIKIVLLGDQSLKKFQIYYYIDVGKTSIAERYVNNNFSVCEPTIGSSYISKSITYKNSNIKFNVTNNL